MNGQFSELARHYSALAQGGKIAELADRRMRVSILMERIRKIAGISNATTTPNKTHV